MDIQRLRYFVTAARLKSFSRAADEQFITQQGISKAISTLETELQTRLFIRGKTIELTEAGKLILQDAEGILQLADRINLSLRNLNSSNTMLRVAYADGILSNLRIDFFSRFLAAHPEVDLQMINCNDFNGEKLLREQRADLAFCTEPYDETNLTALISVQVPIRAVIGDMHPLAGKTDICMADLRGERLISLDEETKHNSFFVRALAEFGLKPKIFIKPQEYQYQFDLCRSGRTIGFYTGSMDRVPDGIHLHNITDLNLKGQYVVLCRKNVRPTVQMTLFAEAIRRECLRNV